MQLKLAEYKEGKFERFLELGKDFMYAGDSVIICGGSVEELMKCMDPIFNNNYFKKDKKDPLNRFEGLFDGRTYGEGRFVLIYSNFSCKNEDKNKQILFEDSLVDDERGVHLKIDIKILRHLSDFEDPNTGEALNLGFAKYLGNIHENPELWKKENWEKAKYKY